MSRYIDADEQMTRIKQVYESMGVDTHGIWNKQLAEAFKGSDVETIRMCLHAILGAITQAPSIDIEPKCGRWIPVDNGHHVRCSECGRCGFTSDNFCPNCGADMRGAENE